MPTFLWIIIAAICFKIGLPFFGWLIIGLLTVAFVLTLFT